MKGAQIALTPEMLMPIPRRMLEKIDLTDVDVYLLHNGKPVLYKGKGKPLSLDSTVEIERLYIPKSEARLIVDEIDRQLQNAFSRKADLENMQIIFDQFSNLVDMSLASPNRENLTLVRDFTYQLAEYMDSDKNAPYLVAFILKKDFTTTLHVTNVGILSTGFACYLSMKGEEYKNLAISAFLHDIGKVKVPDSILNKPGKLSVHEFEIIKKHTVWGAQILRANRFDRYAHVALYHHEFADGSGYPEGLTGSRIPEDAQIVQICDVYEALTGIRPYRDPMFPYDALSLLRDQFVLKGKIRKDLYKEFLTFLYRNRYD